VASPHSVPPMLSVVRLMLVVGLRSLQGLSAATASRLGAWLGVMVFHLGIRRRLASAVIGQSLGIRGPARAQVLKRAYATMGANFIEIWTAGGVDGPENHVDLASPRWIQGLLGRHPAIVFVTLHLGSWDAAVLAAKSVCPRVLAYAKAQHNPVVDALLNERRQVSGAQILLTRQGDRTGAVTVMKALRGQAVVGLLADQRPRTAEGIPATWLGVPTYVHPGPVFFAQRGNVPVVLGVALRVRSGRSRLYILRPIEVAGLDQAAATQLVMDRLSALVAAFPGQYFWHHRRFGDTPATCPPADPDWRLGVQFLRRSPLPA
jgi:Kdo2-lipid IVA lauroyltransferase/acyltransferase